MKLEGTTISQEFIDEWAAYESPVKMIVEKQEVQFMDGVLKACETVGIKVNAEELIKALNYDRMQYFMGFSQGALAAYAKMEKEKAKTVKQKYCQLCEDGDEYTPCGICLTEEEEG